jgi:hypothetical protein
MSKLLALYIADPSAVSAKRIAAYHKTHPFAQLLLNAAESAILIQALSHEEA